MHPFSQYKTQFAIKRTLKKKLILNMKILLSKTRCSGWLDQYSRGINNNPDELTREFKSKFDPKLTMAWMSFKGTKDVGFLDKNLSFLKQKAPIELTGTVDFFQFKSRKNGSQ